MQVINLDILFIYIVDISRLITCIITLYGMIKWYHVHIIRVWIFTLLRLRYHINNVNILVMYEYVNIYIIKTDSVHVYILVMLL